MAKSQPPEFQACLPCLHSAKFFELDFLFPWLSSYKIKNLHDENLASALPHPLTTWCTLTYSLSPSQVYVCVCVSTAKSTYHCRLPWHSPFSTESQSEDCKTCVQQMFLWDFQNSQITFIFVWKSPNPETKSFLPFYVSSCLLNIPIWTFHWHKVPMSNSTNPGPIHNFLISVNDTAAL